MADLGILKLIDESSPDGISVEDIEKIWFDFDYFYSDNSFEQVIEIILESNPDRVFDIGYNTGKFEVVKLSLTHISLYFTALANGNSRMYSCN